MLNYAEGNENGIWGQGDFSTQADEPKQLKKKKNPPKKSVNNQSRNLFIF